MKPTWNEIIEAIKGKLVSGKPEGEFQGVSTDSRNIKTGELFIALTGDNFDGHDFIEAAIQKGASGAIVNRGAGVAISPAQAFIVEVDDTLNALGSIAALWRVKHPVPVVAITGSNGKTTTKEMVALILSQKYRVLKTEGNLNNLIGLPLTILKIDEGHEVAVVELGMNRFGEIARLSKICSPDVALITNVGSGHLGGVGSIEGVAKAKGEILEGLKPEGVLVVNMDDQHINVIKRGWYGRKTVTYALHTKSDVWALYTDYSCCYGDGMTVSIRIVDKMTTIKLRGLGNHNVYNATAAAAVGIAMGMTPEEIKNGLELWKPYKGRFELIRLLGGINLVDDTYNANPDSVEAALDTLATIKVAGRGVAVLGDMLELGDQAGQAHYNIGKMVAATRVDRLFLIGPLSVTHTAAGARDGGMEEGKIVICEDHKDLSWQVNNIAIPGDWVLVKGSRGMGMEKVVYDLIKYRNED